MSERTVSVYCTYDPLLDAWSDAVADAVADAANDWGGLEFLAWCDTLTTDEWTAVLLDARYGLRCRQIVVGPADALGESVVRDVEQHCEIFGERHRRFIAIDFGNGPQPVHPRQMRRQAEPA